MKSTGKARMMLCSRMVVVALLASAIGGCFKKEAIHPSDILQQSAGKGVVMFSTSTPSDRIAFAKGIVLFRVGDDGKRTVVAGYDIDDPAEATDIQADNTRLRWLSVPPGNYVIEMAHTNRFQCFVRAPEFRFSVSAGDFAYLGDLHLEGGQLTIADHLDRDAGFFGSHVNGGSGVAFRMFPVEVKEVDYGCRNQNAPTIFVALPRR